MPEYTKLYFTAKEVNGVFETPEYVKNCADNKIMPFTSIKWECYNGSFRIKEDLKHTAVSDEAVELIIGGGRVARIEFESEIPAKSAFKSFQEVFLDNLLKEGYELKWGELWLTTTYNTGYNSGYSHDTYLYFPSNHKYVVLYFNGGFKEESESDVVKSWFEQFMQEKPVEA